jgi:hypothetical protein
MSKEVENKRAKEKARWNRERAKRRQKAVEKRGTLLEGEGSKERSKARIAAPTGSEGELKARSKRTIEGARKSRSAIRKRRTKAPAKPKKTRYNGYLMDSGAELQFAKLLDEFGVKWVKNTTKKFPYKTARGSIRNYIPDFYLPDFEEWVEIKGRYYQTQNLKAQLDAVGQNIELIYSDEMRLPECCAHLRKESKV